LPWGSSIITTMDFRTGIRRKLRLSTSKTLHTCNPQISHAGCYSKLEKQMRTRFYVLLAILMLVAAQVFAADEFTIDPVHSSANFAVKHLTIGTVHGRFNDLSGKIVYDEKDLSKSSVLAVIKAASVNTDNQTRDKDLRSANFFETDKYPEIRFQSTKVEKIGDQLQVTGNLTMKGVTRQITLPVTIEKAEVKGKTRIGIETRTTVNRFDYNISFDSTGATVGKEIKIDINVEAVK
jgi:polyisoprenoid-binding protein YceI